MLFSLTKESIARTFKFLKAGLDRNEVILTALGMMSEDEIRAKMKKDWKDVNVDRLESSGDILIKNHDNWYFDETGKSNPMHALSEVVIILDDALRRGNAGTELVQRESFFRLNWCELSSSFRIFL